MTASLSSPSPTGVEARPSRDARARRLFLLARSAGQRHGLDRVGRHARGDRGVQRHRLLPHVLREGEPGVDDGEREVPLVNAQADRSRGSAARRGRGRLRIRSSSDAQLPRFTSIVFTRATSSSSPSRNTEQVRAPDPRGFLRLRRTAAGRSPCSSEPMIGASRIALARVAERVPQRGEREVDLREDRRAAVQDVLEEVLDGLELVEEPAVVAPAPPRADGSSRLRRLAKPSKTARTAELWKTARSGATRRISSMVSRGAPGHRKNGMRCSSWNPEPLKSTYQVRPAVLAPSNTTPCCGRYGHDVRGVHADGPRGEQDREQQHARRAARKTDGSHHGIPAGSAAPRPGAEPTRPLCLPGRRVSPAVPVTCRARRVSAAHPSTLGTTSKNRSHASGSTQATMLRANAASVRPWARDLRP